MVILKERKIMQIIEIVVVVMLSSGIGTFVAQKFIELHLNKRFYRFSKLFSDKLDIIRELYRLLIQAERGLNLLLNQREPDDQSKKEKFKAETFEKIDRFVEYFEENEIVFDAPIVSIIDQFRENFKNARKNHNIATMLESDRGSEAWLNAVDKKAELQGKYVVEIPLLKKELRKKFQEEYKLLTK